MQTLDGLAREAGRLRSALKVCEYGLILPGEVRTEHLIAAAAAWRTDSTWDPETAEKHLPKDVWERFEEGPPGVQRKLGMIVRWERGRVGVVATCVDTAMSRSWQVAGSYQFHSWTELVQRFGDHFELVWEGK